MAGTFQCVPVVTKHSEDVMYEACECTRNNFAKNATFKMTETWRDGGSNSFQGAVLPECIMKPLACS
jgi:hypothetical protein